MNIAVVALGKIGLPLAVQFARSGHRVMGADVNPEVVALVNKGVAPFPGEAHLDEFLAEVVASGALAATTDTTEAVSTADVVVVVVPLFVDEEGIPDFAWMDAATKAIASGLRPGTLVSYETTLPVGTTRDRFGPMLDAGSGLRAGRDFHLVFSPERVFTGRVFADLRRYPKLVGGIDPDSTRRGIEFYQAVLDFDDRPDLERPNGVWDMGTAEAAELAKLAETTYRDVNIGLANQFARFADANGIDVSKVIEACNSQPFSHIHSPGIAVGGHCIPVYPRFYLWNDPAATIVDAARKANAQMPAYAVDLLTRVHGDLSGQRVVVLGASYRGGVKETAFSGVFATVAALRGAGAVPLVHDPMFTDSELRNLGFEPYVLGGPVDAAILQANHDEYSRLEPSDVPARTILDGRGALDPGAFPGSTVIALGDGSAIERG
ncbi:MAG: nucleotide sugar dehydrogenase [Candidatus Nanopelagicales bacterium]|nr:nucleotide sugar dehydrogenase [Candidatus Nanopelagicales bacterium]